MNRTYEERNHNNWKKAIRKQKLSAAIYTSVIFNKDGSVNYFPWYSNLHQYSKNKIHCSCPLCSCKTNNKKRKFYGRTYNPSIHDERQILRESDYLE